MTEMTGLAGHSLGEGGREIDEAELTDEERAEMRLFLPKEQTVVVQFMGKVYRLSSLHLTHGFFRRIKTAQEQSGNEAIAQGMTDAFLYLLSKITGLPEDELRDEMSMGIVNMLSTAIAHLREKKMAAAPSGPLDISAN